MLKTIIYLNADLASSIALRYACQLAKITGMEINTFHVEPPNAKRYPPGSGWVRRTWENGLLEQAREKIMLLMTAERDICPDLKKPAVRIGEPENELLRELRMVDYDLFVIGLLHSFSARQFYRRMHSKFYKKAGCPILLVKNLLTVKRVGILIQPEDNALPQAETFLKFFTDAPVEVDILTCIFHRKAALREKGVMESRAAGLPGEKDGAGAAIVNKLEQANFSPNIVVLKGDAVSIGDRLSTYPLVLTSLPPDTGPSSPILECLSRISSAILFCRQ
ncbi:MAG: universal stress protein [Deltaproteobacteria bacterium]|nr:universal stress protein [Deltaproteobacteria bacterium]